MPISPISLPVWPTMLNGISHPSLPDLPVISELNKIQQTVREVVLVAGINYPHQRGKITDGFNAYCTTIAPKLRKKYHGIKFTVFNFFSGNIEEYRFKNDSTFNIFTASGPQPGKLNEENYRYVVDSDDEEKERYVINKIPNSSDHVLYFTSISDINARKDVKKKDYIKAFRTKKLKEKSMSIRDVYNYIENKGKTAKESIVELHIFSHGYYVGPILVNTNDFFERDPTTSAMRFVNDGKYLDKDARSYDFNSKSTLIQNMSDFKAAFAKDAFSVIWGCNAYDSPKQIINQTMKFKDYKEMIKEPDKKLLELEFNNDWGEDTAGEFHRLVNDTAPYSTNRKSEKKSLNDIKKILISILNKTYMKNLAKGTGKNVLGALPGTYANMDNASQNLFGLRLLHIPLGKKYSDDQDFHSILNFYRQHLSIKFKADGEYDPTYGRGYSIYEP